MTVLEIHFQFEASVCNLTIISLWLDYGYHYGSISCIVCVMDMNDTSNHVRYQFSLRYFLGVAIVCHIFHVHNQNKLRTWFLIYFIV